MKDIFEKCQEMELVTQMKAENISMETVDGRRPRSLWRASAA